MPATLGTEGLTDRRADVAVFLAQQLITVLQRRHRVPSRAKYCANSQPTGPPPTIAIDERSRRDDETIGRDTAALDRDGVRGNEGALARARAENFRDRRLGRLGNVRQLVFAPQNCRNVDMHAVRVNTELGRVSDFAEPLRRTEQRLRRHAARRMQVPPSAPGPLTSNARFPSSRVASAAAKPAVPAPKTHRS